MRAVEAVGYGSYCYLSVVEGWHDVCSVEAVCYGSSCDISVAEGWHDVCSRSEDGRPSQAERGL